jgi:LPXTG-site transpeptidase (sortase) family protein
MSRVKGQPLRSILLVAGVIAFVAGAALLATGVYDALTGESEAGPDVHVVDVGSLDTPTATATVVPVTATPIQAGPPLGDYAFALEIEKLGVNAPVETYGLDENAVPEVPLGPDAKTVVAWYDFSARPGTGSNAVFAGHVTWNGQAVFYNLKTTVPGDVVRLRGEDGTVLTYRVTEVFQVDPNDPDSLNVMKATPTDTLTIITCDGAYTDTNDPVFGGEYNRRLVVRASLESVAQAPAA